MTDEETMRLALWALKWTEGQIYTDLGEADPVYRAMVALEEALKRTENTEVLNAS